MPATAGRRIDSMVPGVCLRPRKSGVKRLEHALQRPLHGLSPDCFPIAFKVPALALRPLFRRPCEADESDRLRGRSTRRARDTGDLCRYRALASLQRAGCEFERGLLAYGTVLLQCLTSHSQQLLLRRVRVHDESALEPLGRPLDRRHRLRHPSPGARFRGDEERPGVAQSAADARGKRLQRILAHSTNLFTSARTTSAYPAASMSSAITPNPPLSRRSTSRIGDGLTTSKKRNSRNAATCHQGSSGRSASIARNATTSSQDIAPWSAPPRVPPVRSHAHTPITKKNATIPSVSIGP